MFEQLHIEKVVVSKNPIFEIYYYTTFKTHSNKNHVIHNFQVTKKYIKTFFKLASAILKVMKKFKGKTYESIKILSRLLWLFCKRAVSQVLVGAIKKGHSADIGKTPKNSHDKAISKVYLLN